MSKNAIYNIIKNKKLYFFIAILILGVLLLLVASSGEKKEEQSNLSLDSLDPNAYATMLEERIEALCNRIDGVSSTYAVVTLKGGYQAIYASDSQSSNNSSKNQMVVVGSGSEEQAILEGYTYPEIAGIGIVCHGGDSYVIKNKIVSLISSTFSLSANKIFVVGS